MRGPDKSRASPLTRLSGTGGISELADWPTCVRPRGYGAVAGQPRGPSAHARAMTAYPSTYSNKKGNWVSLGLQNKTKNWWVDQQVQGADHHTGILLHLWDIQ